MERVTETQRRKKKLTTLQQLKMWQNLFWNLSKLLRTEKATLYGWPTIKDKYFRNLKKNDDLQAWFYSFVSVSWRGSLGLLSLN